MRRRLALVVIAVALVSSACIKYETVMNVNDDGSGFIEVLYAFDTEAIGELSDLMGSFDGEGAEDGGTPTREELCADARADASDLGEGVTVEPYDEGKFCGSRLRAEFGPGDDAVATLESVFGATDTTSDEIVLRKEPDGGWRFELTFAPSDDSGLAGDDGLPPGMADDIIGDASITFDVRLPGRPVDHNADEVDGNRFHWDLSLTDPQSQLFAVTEPGEPDSGPSGPLSADEVASGGGGDDGGSNLGLILGIVLGVLVVAGIAFVLIRRRGATPAVATAGAGGPGPQAPAAPPAAAPDGAGAGGPTWDEQRQAWVQYDAGRGGWLVFDDATQEWRPMS